MVIFIRKNIIPACKPIIKDCTEIYKMFSEEYQNILKVMKKESGSGSGAGKVGNSVIENVYRLNNNQDLQISFNYDEEDNESGKDG